MSGSRATFRAVLPVLLCSLGLLLAAGVLSGAEPSVPAPAAAPAPPPAPPPVPANLFQNPDFEADSDGAGVPDGWFRSEPQHWCGPAKDGERWKQLAELWAKRGGVPPNIPLRPPDALEGGTYNWEADGCRSKHSISIDETSERKWGEWDTAVKGIKPNTNYVILGWRKQSERAGRTAGSPPWMKVAAFGTLTPVRGTIARDAWIPFAVTVNSGPFAGDCAVGFVIDGAATKVWIDGVAMYEGTLADLTRFRLGLKGARLDYPLEDTAYASPDVECPLFLDIAWSLYGRSGGAGVNVVIDLPEGLDLTGGACGQGLRLGEPVATAITIEGRPYVRRTFAVQAAPDRAEFDSAGTRPIRLWLKADPALTDGTLEAFYHADWGAGRQPEQHLAVRIIRFDPVKAPRSLLAALGGVPADLVDSRSNKLIKDLPVIGVNSLLIEGDLPDEAAGPLERAGVALAAGFDLAAAKPPVPDAAARDIKNQPLPDVLCPGYRPVEPLKTIFARPAELARAGTVLFFTDLRGAAPSCFCERCVKEFQAFLKQRNPKVEYAAPAVFLADPVKFKELVAAWDEFCAARVADRHWALHKQLDELRRAGAAPLRNAAEPVRVFAFVSAPNPGPAAPGGVAVDYARLATAVDVQVIDPEMNLSDGGGTPAQVGREVGKLVRVLPAACKAGAVITVGATSDRAAMAPLVRHSDVRDQVLEAAVAGAKAVILRPFENVDGLDLQEFSGALGLLSPFDEILAGGQPSNAVTVADGKGSVRCLARDGQMLLLVSDYSDPPAAQVKLEIRTPEGVARPTMVFIDVETGKEEVVGPETKTLVVAMGGERARLFYLGPVQGLPFRFSDLK